MRQWAHETASPEETRRLGQLLGELIAGPQRIYLRGDLGAGKTCFVQGLARGLGVSPAEPVTSPSYTLMNAYSGRLQLFHFDLYRLAHPEDLEDLDLTEYLHGTGVAVVEWAERMPGSDQEGLMVDLEYEDECARSLIFRARGVGAESLLEQLASHWTQGRAAQ
ncbi:MAG: tRNA (adenosine(37)-N6)-threonylcarbamoyltransferase complex ATPase subunit type 1 TsaE [Desulfuromonas sp.]|uniref:tRNA (adenosine(37)-N6)-threonylcarbamoyltransferase complex ATPase subunit type 1 TsaE n=1 Tax=Desulfuromonas sp. TaxID=892 RepID=UPI000CA70C8B|nr:tRNA (adenosine(37)-N6)-threonylcarbamoyltransferase complex ATPase subunit type 1 TsaE [Desulfuromonas sp.]PLX83621.1 MAG: tRNA (adenosine(37)-N6)-threonylcarbamoyltransferase complex ATPase subunit type 1 TsaE [Desulfuromonas sp.]